jgi:glycosyltransferase involved in cell wall biosynthesis
MNSQIRAIDVRLLGRKRTGDETVFFNLTKELLAQDRDHEYWLLTDERDRATLDTLRERLGIVGATQVHLVTLPGQNRFVWNLVTLPWFLLTHNVAVFHTQYILPLFVPARTKVVDHIHDVSFAALPQYIGWSDRLFLSVFIPIALRRADRVVVPSQFTKDEIIRYYGTSGDKIVLVPNALSLEFQALSQPNFEAMRQAYGLPEQYIISVGTLQPRKNLPLLIRAWSKLRERLPEVRLVLVGNRAVHHFDPDIDRAIAECNGEEGVIFPGYISASDLPAVIRMAKVFAFPSRYEGFGIPLLEAMSQDVPVVASDIPCLSEVAGPAALYFDPTSVASCEEKLYTLLTDNNVRENAISLGRGRVSLFSWRASATKLLSLYDELSR